MLKRMILFIGLWGGLAGTSAVYAAASNFISISDIHFNPFLSCQTAPCPLIKNLSAAPASQWQAVFIREGQYRFSHYQEDTDYALLQSALSSLQASAAHVHPRFVLILGDFLGHNYQAMYQRYSGDQSAQGYGDFVDKTIIFLSRELQAAFPGVPIYPVIGNNDSASGDYSEIPSGEFYRATAAAWSPLLDAPNRSAFHKTFPYAGYYSVTVPGETRHRIIVLNTVLFSPYAHSASDAELNTAAETELNWLQSQLEQAVALREQVWIIAHIPVGVDAYKTYKLSFLWLSRKNYWQLKYQERFLQLIAAYQSEIKAELLGHMHMDAMALIKYHGHTIGYISVTPSISPIFGNNAAYKIYQYDPSDFAPLDYSTYYLDLATPAKTGMWQKEYEFNAIYPQSGGSDLQTNIVKLLNGAQLKTAPLMDSYIQYYTVGHKNAQPIWQHFMPYYWCAMSTTTNIDYQVCYDTTHE